MEEQNRRAEQIKREEEQLAVDFQGGEFVFASRSRRKEVKKPSRWRSVLFLGIVLLGGGFSLFYYFHLYQKIPLLWSPPWNAEIRSLTFDFDAIPGDHTLRAVGTVNLPDEALFTITLAKAEEILAQKEARVRDRHFEALFGPSITAHYHFIGETDVFTPGQYQVMAEFNPLQQPEKIQKLVGEHGEKIQEVLGGQVVRPEGLQAPLIQVVKRLTFGSPQEQQQAQEVEEANRQIIRAALEEAVKDLMALHTELQTKYEYQLAEGGLDRTDTQRLQWIEWSQSWRERLEEKRQQHRLTEEISSSSPFYTLREEIARTYKQLNVLENQYFEVLTQESDSQNPELIELQQEIETAITRVREELAIPAVVQRPKTMIQITSEAVNIRRGPNLAHNVISRGNRGEQFEMVSVERGWYQIKLPDGRLGWVHNSLIARQEEPSPSKTSVALSPPLDIKPLPPSARLADIPPPTKDEMRIYAAIEQKFSTIPQNQFHEADKAQIVDEVAHKYGISAQETWNVYLKVQGWQVKQ